MPHTNLIEYFEKIFPISEEEKSILEALFSIKKLKKRQFALQETDSCLYLYFVVEGTLKMYQNTERGSEKITEFAIENQWITDYDSFFQQKASELNIEAQQSSLLLQISKENLYFLQEKHPKFQMVFQQIFINKTIEYQKYMQKIAFANSLDRYLIFEKEFPHLVGKIPQVQIASFLGITPECISRIKNNPLAKK